MFVSTTLGLYSYDVSDPALARLLGALPMYMWENEDMTWTSSASSCSSAATSAGSPPTTCPVSVVARSAPARDRRVGPAVHAADRDGHHADRPHRPTCVEGCRYIWTAGALARRAPAGRHRRAGGVGDGPDRSRRTRSRAAARSTRAASGGPTSESSHDVHVDPAGIAWVSGAGGVWGYWTHGRHRDPRTGKVRTATGCDPIPYGGGAAPRARHALALHAQRVAEPGAARRDGRRLAGTVLMATEENLTSSCATSGRFATYDLRGPSAGAAWNRGEDVPMKVLDTWTPEGQPGSTGCDSAHYFEDRGDGLLAYAFYEQGVRFLDASNPRDIRQVGYWLGRLARRAWAAYWHGGYVFVADYRRGVDVLRFTGRPGGPAARVPAPAPGRPPPRRSRRTRRSGSCAGSVPAPGRSRPRSLQAGPGGVVIDDGPHALADPDGRVPGGHLAEVAGERLIRLVDRVPWRITATVRDGSFAEDGDRDAFSVEVGRRHRRPVGREEGHRDIRRAGAGQGEHEPRGGVRAGPLAQGAVGDREGGKAAALVVVGDRGHALAVGDRRAGRRGQVAG